MPFISLARLPEPDPGVPIDPTIQQVSFDPGQVEKLFYDSQCTCDKPGETCFRSADCCPQASLCFSEPATQVKTCSTCRAQSQTCNNDLECCPGMIAGCYPVTDAPGAPKACQACLFPGRTCDPNGPNKCCDACKLGPNGYQCGKSQ